jgi:transcriptional regulator with XRE-family HTH domain
MRNDPCFNSDPRSSPSSSQRSNVQTFQRPNDPRFARRLPSTHIDQALPRNDSHSLALPYQPVSPLPPNEQLKELRSRLGITTRDVAEFSLKIAESEGNPEFQISNAWLTQIENSDSVPSIFKLYSLSAIYRIKFTDLLLLYGLDMQKLNMHQLAAPLPQTHLTSLEVYDADRTVSFPVRFDRSFDLDSTNLLSRMVELWGEIPIALLQHMDIRHSQYGFIGLQDFTLHPLLRPGSFVQIDARVRKVRPMRWRTEFDRPIYFVELRDGYACSWCDLLDGQLLLLPHPLSPCSARRFNYGTDAEIVGQVTAVAMRLTEASDAPPDGTAKLPKRV